MLPEIGATEWMVIAAVVLIVVGPKDLPVLLRKVGQFVGRLRAMANDFRSSFDEMARQSELDELRKEVAAMRSGQSNLYGDDINRTFDDIGSSLNDTPTVDTVSPDTYDYPEVSAPDDAPKTEISVIEPAKPKRARKPKAAAEPAVIVESPKPPRRRATKIVEGEPAQTAAKTAAKPTTRKKSSGAKA